MSIQRIKKIAANIGIQATDKQLIRFAEAISSNHRILVEGDTIKLQRRLQVTFPDKGSSAGAYQYVDSGINYKLSDNDISALIELKQQRDSLNTEIKSPKPA